MSCNLITLVNNLKFTINSVAEATTIFPISEVHGFVTDSTGKGIENVAVKIKGSSTGTLTGRDGAYTLKNVPNDAVLEFSYIGMKTEAVAVNGRSDVSVMLYAQMGNLNDVVIVGYGTQKKGEVTGAISVVGSGAIQDKTFTSVDKTLQGNVAGLQSVSASGAPGSATSIVLRGIGSIQANTNPLWVIDGVIASTGELTSFTSTSNALSGLNPDDIESITVLKDASATAIYGSRAANGVILVTTKKGKAGKTAINFSAEAGKNSIAFRNKNNQPMNSLQYQTFLREAIINAGYASDNAGADGLITSALGIPENYTSTNTNWIDMVTHNGNQEQYNLNLNGGNEKTQFYASAGYFDQQGTTIATYFKRWNGSLSVTHKAFGDRLTFTAGVSGSNSLQNTPFNGGALANPVLESYLLLPWYTPYNPDGSLRYNDSLGEFPVGGGLTNPLVIAAWNKNQANQTQLRGYVSGEYKILHNLTFTSRYSGEYFDIEEHKYENPLYGNGYASKGDDYDLYTRIYDWTWSNFANWTPALDRNKFFKLDLTAGYEAQARNEYLLEAVGTTFPQTVQLQYLASAASPIAAYAAPSQNAYISYFSRGNISYKDLYVISGSFRRDGSSVFGVNRRWGNFYSVGGSWNINNEKFLKNNPTVTMLKLRASYGETGNSMGGSFGDYSALATYSIGANYMLQPGSYPNSVGNPNLTWEKNGILNIGLDFGFIKNNRITGTIEYYVRKTSGLLVNVPLSMTSGFSSGLQNAGNIQNKGVEVTLGGKPFVTRNFTWVITGTFSHNQNRVTALYQGNPIYVNPFNYTQGHDIQEFYMLQWAGVDPANGNPLWYTDGTHSATTSNINNAALAFSGKHADPSYFGSLTNSFTFKGFTLSAQLYYNFGNYIFDQMGQLYYSDGAHDANYNQLTSQLNAWQKPGDVTNTPKIMWGGNQSSNVLSTRYLYKGNYIRLRDIQLSYALPKAWMQKIRLNAASIYVHGTNLFTFATDKNIPVDPEDGINGFTNFEVFIPKTITGGIKISL